MAFKDYDWLWFIVESPHGVTLPGYRVIKCDRTQTLGSGLAKKNQNKPRQEKSVVLPFRLSSDKRRTRRSLLKPTTYQIIIWIEKTSSKQPRRKNRKQGGQQGPSRSSRRPSTRPQERPQPASSRRKRTVTRQPRLQRRTTTTVLRTTGYNRSCSLEEMRKRAITPEQNRQRDLSSLNLSLSRQEQARIHPPRLLYFPIRFQMQAG